MEPANWASPVGLGVFVLCQGLWFAGLGLFVWFSAKAKAIKWEMQKAGAPKD